MKATLTYTDFARAAAALKCEIAAIRAVCEIEAPAGGFLPDGQVTILPERHWFHQLTKGKFSGTHPTISNPEPGGYGPAGQHQHTRLAKMVALDREAALLATSWGKFQIMGFNHKRAGFPTIQAFINAMHDGEPAQLDTFVTFIKSDPVMHRALQKKDWAKFAYRYNGRAYAKHGYHTRLAAAYRKYAG